MSILSQIAATLLQIALPAIEQEHPAVKTFLNAILALEGGQPVPVKVPLLGTITLQKTV